MRIWWDKENWWKLNSALMFCFAGWSWYTKPYSGLVLPGAIVLDSQKYALSNSLNLVDFTKLTWTWNPWNLSFIFGKMPFLLITENEFFHEMQSHLLCVDRQHLLWTGSFSEQLVHVTGSIFFLTVNTAYITHLDWPIMRTGKFCDQASLQQYLC